MESQMFLWEVFLDALPWVETICTKEAAAINHIPFPPHCFYISLLTLSFCDTVHQ